MLLAFFDLRVKTQAVRQVIFPAAQGFDGFHTGRHEGRVKGGQQGDDKGGMMVRLMASLGSK